MNKRISGSIGAALAVAIAATSLNIAPAQAASKAPQVSQTSTDFSARRRWHRGNAAGLAVVAGMFGTIAALAAADRYNDGYYDGGYYGPGYGGGYYRGGGGHWRGHGGGHHHHH